MNAPHTQTAPQSDAATDRGAAIIRRAVQLLREGAARSWSHALALAADEYAATN